LSTVLDDLSRYIIAWKPCTTIKADDVTATLEMALHTSGLDKANVFHRPRSLSEKRLLIRLRRPGEIDGTSRHGPRGLVYLNAGRYEESQADFAKEIAQDSDDNFAVIGRDRAAAHSNSADCTSLPVDPHPGATYLVDVAGQLFSDCYSGPGRI
jgi:hypothetical protein